MSLIRHDQGRLTCYISDVKSKTTLAVSVVLVVAAAGLFATVKWVLPNKLKSTILKTVNDGCTDCALQIASVDISFLQPGHFVFHDVRVEAGQGGHSMVEARIETLDVNLKLSESSREKLTFESVEGQNVGVIYSEGDAKKIDVPEKKSEHPMEFAVLSTKLTKANFRYVHTQGHTTSILHVQDINAELSAIGTTKELKDVMTNAHLTGQIEKSGRGEVTIAALTRPGPHYVDFTLTLANQSLESLTPFFKPNDGLELKGELIKGVATVNVRDQKAKSNVLAIYKDVELKQLTNPKKSGIEAFLTNIGAALLVTKTNEGRLTSDQSTDLEVARDHDETVVHFILRSVKEGLLQIAKKKDSRTAAKDQQAALVRPPIGCEQCET